MSFETAEIKISVPKQRFIHLLVLLLLQPSLKLKIGRLS